MLNTDDFNLRIANVYIEQLSNRDIPQQKALITFSGIPGSGKTTLARKLEHDLNAQYVHHDSLRKIIESEGDDPKRYTMIPISRIVITTILNNDANKRIILDASIDRSWDVFFNDKKEFGISQSVIIRLNTPHDVIKQRQLQRDGKINLHFDEFASQFEACKREVEADVELDDNYDYELVLKTVDDLLRD